MQPSILPRIVLCAQYCPSSSPHHFGVQCRANTPTPPRPVLQSSPRPVSAPVSPWSRFPATLNVRHRLGDSFPPLELHSMAPAPGQLNLRNRALVLGDSDGKALHIVQPLLPGSSSYSI